jgi:glutaredoxin
MSMTKIFQTCALLGSIAGCFLVGLYGAPLAKGTYFALFPAPEYKIGDYSQIYDMAGKQVVLFSTSTCPYCEKTRALLAKLGVSYQDYMIDKSPEAETAVRKLDGSAVPLLFVGARRIKGYRESTIRHAIALLPKANQSHG